MLVSCAVGGSDLRPLRHGVCCGVMLCVQLPAGLVQPIVC